MDQLVATSAKRAWLLTSHGRVLATASAGAAWTVDRLPVPVLQLALSKRWLWALACRHLRSAAQFTCRPVLERMRLSDGRWTRLPLPAVRSDLQSRIAVPADGTVILRTARDAGAGGELLSSIDGGMRWTVRHDPVWAHHGRCDVADGPVTAGRRVWWLLCLGGAAAGSSTKALLRTQDGGSTWTTVSAVDSLTAPLRRRSLPGSEPGAMAAGSTRRFWLALQNGLAQSTDAGAHWNGVPKVNPEGASTSFDVLSPTTAWLLAPGAGMWRTTDGSHWQAVGPLHTG
jgi:photosystem II stability/assembly factor-like uncharacterized protein